MSTTAQMPEMENTALRDQLLQQNKRLKAALLRIHGRWADGSEEDDIAEAICDGRDAAESEVERLSARTCTHHTDAERAAAGCPVCARAEVERRANIYRIELERLTKDRDNWKENYWKAHGDSHRQFLAWDEMRKRSDVVERENISLRVEAAQLRALQGGAK